MRLLIGDSRINQRFLAIAARRAGFEETVGAETADELFERAPAVDVIAYDPATLSIDRPIDVTLALVRLVPQTPLIVVSSRIADLDRAERNGFTTVRKLSIFDLDPLTSAFSAVRDLVVARLLVDQALSGASVLELLPGPAQPMVGYGAQAPVLAAPVGAG